MLLFGFILLGAAVLHLSTTLALSHVPITIVFFVLEIAFTLLAEHGGLAWVQPLLDSYNDWSPIDPHLLLFTLLPPLLFGNAFVIDTHMAKRTAGQCLIVAGPGVPIGAFVCAALLYFLLPYGWSFATCLMIGSILSATHPVAVVSLLKDLGASPVLTRQIQGESMLNDGTAMVLFKVAYMFVSKKDVGVDYITKYALMSTLGAFLLGGTLSFLFFLVRSLGLGVQ